MKIGIKGIGVLGGFGCGLSALAQALDTGHVPHRQVTLNTARGELEVPALLADTSPLTDFIPRNALRRTDHYTRMALLGAHLALKDAGISGTEKERMGIIVATGYGSTCNTFDFQNLSEPESELRFSPTRFSNSAHNAAAAHISVFLKINGPNLSVNHFNMSIPSALLTACGWLAEKRVAHVLVGGVDAFSNVMGYYRHRLESLGKTAGTGSTSPVVIGEGCAFFLLTGEENAPYGYIAQATVGRFNGQPLSLPEDMLLFQGIDGFGQHDENYGRCISGPRYAAAYTPLYGCNPVGMAFDLAIAGISIETGTVCPSPLLSGKTVGLEPALSPQALSGRSISCLKINDADEFGMVTVSPILDRS
jgi:3-oxoacyl-[acyl-carrier-protein] synthase II